MSSYRRIPRPTRSRDSGRLERRGWALRAQRPGPAARRKRNVALRMPPPDRQARVVVLPERDGAPSRVLARANSPLPAGRRHLYARRFGPGSRPKLRKAQRRSSERAEQPSEQRNLIRSYRPEALLCNRSALLTMERGSCVKAEHANDLSGPAPGDVVARLFERAQPAGSPSPRRQPHPETHSRARRRVHPHLPRRAPRRSASRSPDPIPLPASPPFPSNAAEHLEDRRPDTRQGCRRRCRARTGPPTAFARRR